MAYVHLDEQVSEDHCCISDTEDAAVRTIYDSDSIDTVETFSFECEETPEVGTSSSQSQEIEMTTKFHMKSTDKFVISTPQQWQSHQSMLSLFLWNILFEMSKLGCLTFISLCLLSITCIPKNWLRLIVAMLVLKGCSAYGVGLQPKSRVLSLDSSGCFQIEVSHQLWDTEWDLTRGVDRQTIYSRKPEKTFGSDLKVTCYDGKCTVCLSPVKYEHSGLYCASFPDGNDDKCLYVHVISGVKCFPRCECQFIHSGPDSTITLQHLCTLSDTTVCESRRLTDQINLVNCRSCDDRIHLLFEVKNPVDKAATNIATYNEMAINGHASSAKALHQISPGCWLLICGLVFGVLLAIGVL